jgi:tetratricopeptide (TPR) repeat protein
VSETQRASGRRRRRQKDGRDAGQQTVSGGVQIDNATVAVQGSIVGRDQNIFTTYFTRLPTSTRIGVIIIAAAAVLTLVVLTATQFETIVHLVRGPGPMTGEFNVAIAAFGQIDAQGQVQSSPDGDILSKTIGATIGRELAGLPNVNAQVRSDGVALVRERDPSIRDASLRDLTQRLNADLIIYGWLVGSGAERTVQPEFYVRGGPAGAGEIIGSNQLGTPVGVPEEMSKAVASQALSSRVEALTQFTLGLENLIQGNPDTAVTWFSQAVATPGWRDQEGKEIAYLFLGTAYKVRDKGDDLEQAYQAYKKSADLNPRYARAYIGMGNVYYTQYARSSGQHPDLLDLALNEYNQAETASDRPAGGLVEGKVHLTQANVYLVRAETGDPTSYPLAEQHFQWIIDSSLGAGSADVAELLPRAYFGMAVIYERRDNDLTQAAEYYQKTIASAGRGDDDVKQLATRQLAIVGGPRNVSTAEPQNHQ